MLIDRQLITITNSHKILGAHICNDLKEPNVATTQKTKSDSVVLFTIIIQIFYSVSNTVWYGNTLKHTIKNRQNYDQSIKERRLQTLLTRLLIMSISHPQSQPELLPQRRALRQIHKESAYYN